MNEYERLLTKANALINDNKLDEAKLILLELLESNNSNPAILHKLGIIEFKSRVYIKAHEYLKQATLYSDDIEIKKHLGTLLHRMTKYKEALSIYLEVLESEPENIGILNNLCAIKLIFGQLSEAKSLAEKVIKLKPEYIDSYINLGNILKDMGNLKESINYYQQALNIDPYNQIAYSNMLLAYHYTFNEKKMVYQKHLDWENHINKIYRKSNLHTYSENDKIRVGYLSADFKKHSVSYFIDPILINHNREKFEIYCYSDVISPDHVTVSIKNHDLTWRNIHPLTDQEVLAQIAEDKIDILIDLAGHAGNKRLRVFQAKAAPIQITYCGYPDTTGIKEIDYRITDYLADPEGEEKFYSEELIRMTKTFLCYKPSPNPPQVCNTPAIQNGYITFGSFNHLSKLSNETIDLWSEIIKLHPNSKLLLKAKQLSDDKVKEIVVNKFQERGVNRENLELTNQVADHNAHLSLYNKIDIALDPFPYNGTTTTCEALWMGVPVVTLIGNTHAGRVGSSLLTNVGLKSLVTENYEGYIQVINYLTQDLNKLNRLRMGLRNALILSPICDAKNFTKELEDVFLKIIEKEVTK